MRHFTGFLAAAMSLLAFGCTQAPSATQAPAANADALYEPLNTLYSK